MMAFPKRSPSRFRSAAEAVLMSMGSDCFDTIGCSATGCTTGAADFRELGLERVFEAEGRGDALSDCGAGSNCTTDALGAAVGCAAELAVIRSLIRLKVDRFSTRLETSSSTDR
jgi:hypothetical protein